MRILSETPRPATRTAELLPGDLVEILYRAMPAGFDGHARDRWIKGEITDVDHGSRPLVRLADGQLTEIRQYMQWRHTSRRYVSVASEGRDVVGDAELPVGRTRRAPAMA